ncbi:hypothetical protein D9613_012785 [Agrocybe pediades]|uniref:Uncharacterized protein n=1 Tax=Agrocybe pediades TaxID=84607 RepID=A0A8H4R4N1_9AGAR|nr:hypothetical protein D9613_012785 [Agrocybe pediades]
MQFISKTVFITMALLATTLVVSAAPEGALATTAPMALRKPFPSGLDVAPEPIHTRAGSILIKTVLETRPATRAAEAAVQRRKVSLAVETHR